MALTKVRPPVTDISLLSNTTSHIDIPTAASDIDINVAGLDIIDIGQTTIIVDDLVTLTANNLASEQLVLTTVAGAGATLETTASYARIHSTTSHPVRLGANSLVNLTLETTGRVTLGTVGTLAAELIDKNYVDTQFAALLTSVTGNAAANPGHIVIPMDTGDDIIINWGLAPLAANGVGNTVTFDLAFPNAIFVAFANPYTSAHYHGPVFCHTLTQTNMIVGNVTDQTTASHWIAIGY